MKHKLGMIWAELGAHAPFTLFGASTGIVCMVLFRNVGPEINHRLFQVFHPAHVVLSAIVTASIFKLYDKRAGLLKIAVIGYLGAIGVATVSDCVLPFFGESIFGVAIPSHSHMHTAEDAGADDHNHSHDHEHEHDHSHGVDSSSGSASIRDRLHFGFIEDWYLVNPAALVGIAIAVFLPRTKFPHAGHVLISTWASSFHVLMNTRSELTTLILLGMFAVLFVAVWLPCCVSDIIFPLLFIKSDVEIKHCHH
jgi:hypothetical protein